MLVFCAIGALLFAAFAPDTVVGDTWMSLVSGREIVDHGLPHVDHLTIYGAGKTWTDQQWLAHLVLYGSERLGGFGLVTFVSGLSVLLAYGISLVVVRARGATTRATLLVFIVVAVRRSLDLDGAGAGARAAALRRASSPSPSTPATASRRRSWLVIPILVLWGNLHGSAFLGALIVSAVGVLELAAPAAGAPGRRFRGRALAGTARDPVRPRCDGPLLPAVARRPALRGRRLGMGPAGHRVGDDRVRDPAHRRGDPRRHGVAGLRARPRWSCSRSRRQSPCRRSAASTGSRSPA